MNKIFDVVKQIQISRIMTTSAQDVADLAIVEKFFILTVNDTVEFKILCTPCDMEALVIGLLFSENIIESAQDILSIDFCKDFIDVRVKKISDNFGVVQNKLKTKNADNVFDWRNLYSHIRPNNILLQQIHVNKIMFKINELQERQEIFAKTGAAHAALLFNCCDCEATDEKTYFAEDIGRHNAIDKVIGKHLQQKQNLKHPVAYGIALSSRVSFELVHKMARAGIELIAAVSAPSLLAIEAAEHWQITLCGFVRGGKMNIYTHPERIFVNV